MPEIGRASGDCGAGTSRVVAVAGAEGCSPDLLGLATSGQIETDASLGCVSGTTPINLKTTDTTNISSSKAAPCPEGSGRCSLLELHAAPTS